MKIRLRAYSFFLAFFTAPVWAQKCLPPSKQFYDKTAIARTNAPSEKQEDDAVDDYIKKAMARQHIPGLSLAVIRDGKIIKSKGYGLASLEHNVAAGPETVYELASASKPILAMAIMLLIQDGKIDLEDRISKHLQNTPDTWKSVTIRHLLTQTSGIKDYLNEMRHDFPHYTTPEKVAQIVGKEPLGFAPGENWSYSNTGYILLGMIVHKVSGKSYDAFLDERVFKPLGMRATRHDSPDEIIPNRAAGYLWTGPGGLRNGDYLKYLMMNHGDRGLLSTVLDLAKFDAALSSNRLLSSSSREAMWTPVKLNNGQAHNYGLGWFLEKVNGHRHFSHPGGAPGSATMISRYPDDGLTVIFLANGGAAFAQGLDLGIAQRYIPDLVARKVIKQEPALLDSYTGYYNAYGRQLLKVTRAQSVLVLDDGGRLTNEFLPLSATKFVAEDADRAFTIIRNAKGAVEGMKLRLGPDEMNVQRIGSFFGSLKPGTDPNPALTRKVEAVLKAMALGGEAVHKVANIAPQARKDYAHMTVSEYKGIQAVLFIGAQDVAGRGIERHGGQVSRVVYYIVHTDKAHRNVLVYLTADGHVTDEDVVHE